VALLGHHRTDQAIDASLGILENSSDVFPALSADLLPRFNKSNALIDAEVKQAQFLGLVVLLRPSLFLTEKSFDVRPQQEVVDFVVLA
jgi:hypothetical protein